MPLREGRRRKSTGNGRARFPFQFTPLREGRLVLQPPCALVVDISIHAPPRGATLRVFLCAIRHPYFNSRPSARGDRTKMSDNRNRVLFQFTPLREGRRGGRRRRCCPRPISIHAPPRGATAGGSAGRWRLCYFNSRPSARGDKRRKKWYRDATRFQFTPLREGRQPPPRKPSAP